MPMYNPAMLQQRTIYESNRNPYKALSPYGGLRAGYEANKLSRQLQYQRMAQANRMGALQHRINIKGLKNRMGELKLAKKRFRDEQSMFSISIALGLGTTGLNAWQKWSQGKERKADIARQRAAIESLYNRNSKPLPRLTAKDWTL